MSMHIEKQSSIIDTTKIPNTKNPNMFGKIDVIVRFGDSLKSINTGEVYSFTNFFDCKKVRYKYVKEDIRRIYYGSSSLIDKSKYKMDLVNYSRDMFLQLKIDCILEMTSGKKSKNIPILYKFKEKRNKELQYYVERKDVDNFEVKFIDIYHLAIPAPNSYLGEKKEHSTAIYEKHKNDNICLSEIKRELNINLEDKELVHQ